MDTYNLFSIHTRVVYFPKRVFVFSLFRVDTVLVTGGFLDIPMPEDRQRYIMYSPRASYCFLYNISFYYVLLVFDVSVASSVFAFVEE